MLHKSKKYNLIAILLFVIGAIILSLFVYSFSINNSIMVSLLDFKNLNNSIKDIAFIWFIGLIIAIPSILIGGVMLLAELIDIVLNIFKKISDLVR